MARAALDAGAHLINDVSGLGDPEIADHCARVGAGLVIMHTRAAPKVKAFPAYDDVVEDVGAFLEDRIALARARGVRAEQVVIEPRPGLRQDAQPDRDHPPSPPSSPGSGGQSSSPFPGRTSWGR